jgi:hypothetical protein
MGGWQQARVASRPEARKEKEKKKEKEEIKEMPSKLSERYCVECSTALFSWRSYIPCLYCTGSCLTSCESFPCSIVRGPGPGAAREAEANGCKARQPVIVELYQY